MGFCDRLRHRRLPPVRAVHGDAGTPGSYGALVTDGTAEAAETVDFDAFEEATDAPAYRERERQHAAGSADE